MSLPINQMGGSGGLNDAALALADATPADVAAGKTFYAGNKELRTGTGEFYKIMVVNIDDLEAGPNSTTISVPGTFLFAGAVGAYTSGSGKYSALIANGLLNSAYIRNSSINFGKISYLNGVITVSSTRSYKLCDCTVYVAYQEA